MSFNPGQQILITGTVLRQEDNKIFVIVSDKGVPRTIEVNETEFFNLWNGVEPKW